MSVSLSHSPDQAVGGREDGLRALDAAVSRSRMETGVGRGGTRWTVVDRGGTWWVSVIVMLQESQTQEPCDAASGCSGVPLRPPSSMSRGPRNSWLGVGCSISQPVL